MRIKRTSAIAKKEIIQIWRDPLSLVMAFFIPVFLLITYGYAITFDVDDIPMVVYDMDNSSLSRELVSAMTESGYFKLIGYAGSMDDIDKSIDSGRAVMAVAILPGFSNDFIVRKNAQVGVIVDGSDSNTAAIAKGYAEALMRAFALRAVGMGDVKPMVDARVRVWYNAELKSKNFIIPGLIAVIMSVIAAILTSLTIAREWERGTMEQLISTPVRKSELILGKLIPYFMIGFIDTLIAILMGAVLFDVTLKGSAVLLMTLASVFLFGGLSWGIFISVVARTQMLASQMAMLSTYLPALLLSGFMFNISNMPKALQLVTYIVPARYFVTILKSIFMKGGAVSMLIVEAALLAAYAAAVFMLANRKFNKQIG